MKRNMSNLAEIILLTTLSFAIPFKKTNLKSNALEQRPKKEIIYSMPKFEPIYLPSESLVRALTPNYREFSKKLDKTYELLENQGMYPLSEQELINPSKRYMENAYEHWKNLTAIQKDSLMMKTLGNYPNKQIVDSLQIEYIKSKLHK